MVRVLSGNTLLMRKGLAAYVERMKTKNFYVVVTLVVLTSCVIWLLNYQSPTFHSIVDKTHKGIKSLPSNIQQIQVGV
jgi:hypothetical protein